MRKSILIVPVLAACLVSGSALADPPKSAAPPPPPPAAHSGGPAYGAAGCGLGSIFFGSKPGFIQVLAATTNGSSGNQTFGITSGTSNCDTAPGGSASAKVFIVANREALSKDIARGSGETITNLSTLAGCQNPATVGATLQKNFKTIFPDAAASDDKVGSAIIDTLKTDKSLSCGNLT
jgi:hypothetical protein